MLLSLHEIFPFCLQNFLVVYFAMPMAASASFTRLGSANFESSNNMGESEELIMADRVFKKSSTNPSRKSKSVTKLRKKFPETWIWSNLTSE